MQAGCQLENAAFAFDQFLLEIFFAAAIGDVFSEDHHAFVPAHFIAQRRIDEIGHRLGGRLLAIGASSLVFRRNGLGVERR